MYTKKIMLATASATVFTAFTPWFSLTLTLFRSWHIVGTKEIFKGSPA